MQKVICSIFAVILAVCAVQAIAAPSQTADARSKSTKQEVYVLARIMQPLQQLLTSARDLEAVIAKELPSNMAKRQSAWDLDYGWGGGRFGKRGEAKKRYDMYGFGGGRFGRDVDHVDIDAHH